MYNSRVVKRSSKELSTTQRIRENQSVTSLVVDVPLSDCRPNPNQPRKSLSEGGLEDLAASIQQHGLLQPIVVMRNKRDKEVYVVVAGERRFRASKLLGLETIPAIVVSGNTDEIALVENLQREDLTPIEEAEALSRLQRKHKYSHEELGRIVGKSRSTISHVLKLASLPRRIKKECATSHFVTRSLLIEISKLPNSKEQLKYWDEVKERGATIREARTRKNAGREKKIQTDTRRTLTTGKRFVGELERLLDEDADLDAGRYEELLNVYERLVASIDKVAEKQIR